MRVEYVTRPGIHPAVKGRRCCVETCQAAGEAVLWVTVHDRGGQEGRPMSTLLGAVCGFHGVVVASAGPAGWSHNRLEGVVREVTP